MCSDDVYRLTHALLRPETAVAAAAALRGSLGNAEVEGLIELVYCPTSARAALAALDALDGCADDIVLDALGAALTSTHASVRLAAVRALHQRRALHLGGALAQMLRQDGSWLVRRAVLEALADHPAPNRWLVLEAATDPHWRVRHALIRVLLPWGEAEALRPEIDDRLARIGDDARAKGVREYLRYRWDDREPEGAPTPAGEALSRSCPFWDWDAAVLARNLERMGTEGRRRAIGAMPDLLGHADERVRGFAVDALRKWGEPEHVARALEQLDEPRNGTVESVQKLVSYLDLDRAEEVARFILDLPTASPRQRAWALDQAGDALPIDAESARLRDLMLRATSQPSAVRCALARLATRWEDPSSLTWLTRFVNDCDPNVQLEALRGLNRRREIGFDADRLRRLLSSESPSLRIEAVKAVATRRGDVNLLEATLADRDATVRACLAECLLKGEHPQRDAWLARFQADPHPHVRAAALTPARAAEIVGDPSRDTSWHVRAKAARMTRTPLWKLGPDSPWRPDERRPAAPEPLFPKRPGPPHARLLGPDCLLVAPLGISGHYGLPVEGFVRAVEAGVNLLFWEPNYQTLTEFATRLPQADRHALHVVAGTFEADDQSVRRDAERVLRVLRIERIAIFLLFWVQSWHRITPDVRETLERLRAEGKVAAYGLSTHSRPLAVEALEAGWNPVMVRHSAAHRGAETQLFPKAVELGTSLLTFNNTCYGRLLKPLGDRPPLRASDCYRYALAQPGVRACWSAPATLDQLEEDLTALRDPELPDDRRAYLQAHGEALYREETTFRKLVRAM